MKINCNNYSYYNQIYQYQTANNQDLNFKSKQKIIKPIIKTLQNNKEALAIAGLAQLSLLALHDFHGQNIRMERTHTLIDKYDKGTLFKEENCENFFSENIPVDKIKLASGDMFIGNKEKELAVVNEFMNLAGIEATAIGNHECDYNIEKFADITENRKYKFLAANMHPPKDSTVNEILSKTFVIEKNGNKYGIIGLAPSDIAEHLKNPSDKENYNVSDMTNTITDLKKEVSTLKEKGINKIIVLSHLGYDQEKKIAQSVSGIDVILGGHTHNLITEAKSGENLLKSPTGEPVLIMQVGKDGEYVGAPNLIFNELGQIIKIQYNTFKTSNYKRSETAKEIFENILGTPIIIGKINNIKEIPTDVYAYENPNCNFILDCIKDEYKSDIAIMNSSNIRGSFQEGDLDTRIITQLLPFSNELVKINISEADLVEALENITKKTIQNPFHRPGIIQVSGLKYEYSMKDGKIKKMSFINNNGETINIDVTNPKKDKFYSVVADEFCFFNEKSGLNLKHKTQLSVENLNSTQKIALENYLKKHSSPIEIKPDGRITVIE